MQDSILSVGVDIGTSTTQLIFSRLTIENQASSFSAPQMHITKKEILYNSEIYFTPLSSASYIDAEKVEKLIISEYKKAGYSPRQITTGAVIITGESARKENASKILESLSSFAGNFVASTAGPALESLLSGRGAGADKLSEKHHAVVANIDVGGGTSNISVFREGKLIGVSCLDIGGRLIKIDKSQGKISYVFPKIEQLSKQCGIPVSVGDRVDEKKLGKLCEAMADILFCAANVTKNQFYSERLYTNEGKPLPKNIIPQEICFSGGVADCIYKAGKAENLFAYDDIGIILGEKIRKNSALGKIKLSRGSQTIRATVVGAGLHTMKISGSTVFYSKNSEPIKNVPIIKISKEEENGNIENTIKNKLEIFMENGISGPVAITFSGEEHTSYLNIQNLARQLTAGAEAIIQSKYPLVLIAEQDIGKALGHAVNQMLNCKKEIISLDGIQTNEGDYIDIGEPVSDGKVIPIVVKTLVFNI